jgi:hypothetical protein
VKVKDVLAMIGDKPLLDVLEERGYVAFPNTAEGRFDMAAELETHGYDVFTEDEDSKMAACLADRDYYVVPIEEAPDYDTGFELYRNRRQ